MFATKYIVPTLAVLGFTAGQSSLCSQPTATINSQDDASKLAASCSTVSGSIAIATSVAGDCSLDGIERITGSLSVSGAINMTSLSARDMKTIDGDMSLDRLTILSSLLFPKLTKVGAIKWTHLVGLERLGFTTGVQKADQILISDTQLNSLTGIDPVTVINVEINNNIYLHSWSSRLVNITNHITINSNAQDLALNFPSLIRAGNMTMRKISSISLPSLSEVTGTFGFYSNNIDSIFCPNITTAGVLAIVDNPLLGNVSMPLLKTISDGALLIANNTNLSGIDGFPNLASVGAVDVTGNFKSASLPALNNDKGAFNMQSTGNFDCAPFQTLKNKMLIRGDFTCKPNSNSVQPGTGSETPTSSSSTPSSSPKGAASVARVDMSTVVGLSALVGGLLQLLM